MWDVTLSSQHHLIRQKEIIIESDSKNTLAWINKLQECPWHLRFLANKLRNVVLTLNVAFQHKHREENDIADALAKEGSQSDGGWISWS